LLPHAVVLPVELVAQARVFRRERHRALQPSHRLRIPMQRDQGLGRAAKSFGVVRMTIEALERQLRPPVTQLLPAEIDFGVPRSPRERGLLLLLERLLIGREVSDGFFPPARPCEKSTQGVVRLRERGIEPQRFAIGRLGFSEVLDRFVGASELERDARRPGLQTRAKLELRRRLSRLLLDQQEPPESVVGEQFLRIDLDRRPQDLHRLVHTAARAQRSGVGAGGVVVA